MEPPGSVRPKRILVAEDQAIVALAIEGELGDAGHEVIGPFSTCAAASRWLRDGTPDFAVLDWQLSDGPCIEVALELKSRGVPFAIFSASRNVEAPEAFRDVPWFEKPSDLNRLAALIATL